MTKTLHLHAVADHVEHHDHDDAPGAAPIFFVIQRANGSWSPAAKIMSVHDNESVAETTAANLKDKHPQQTFGVAALRSEARTVLNPIEIVRVNDLPAFDGNQVAT